MQSSVKAAALRASSTPACAGIVEACRGQKAIRRTLGMRYGIEGFMHGEVIDLGAETPATIAALRTTPSSALGSCRHKVKDANFPQILEMLRRFDIRYYFLIGGNDTMDTIHRVEAYCRSAGLRADRRGRAQDRR